MASTSRRCDLCGRRLPKLKFSKTDSSVSCPNCGGIHRYAYGSDGKFALVMTSDDMCSLREKTSGCRTKYFLPILAVTIATLITASSFAAYRVLYRDQRPQPNHESQTLGSSSLAAHGSARNTFVDNQDREFTLNSIEGDLSLMPSNPQSNTAPHIFKVASWCPYSVDVIDNYLLPFSRQLGWNNDEEPILLVFSSNEWLDLNRSVDRKVSSGVYTPEEAAMIRQKIVDQRNWAVDFDPELGRRFVRPDLIVRLMSSPILLCEFTEDSRTPDGWPQYYAIEQRKWTSAKTGASRIQRKLQSGARSNDERAYQPISEMRL